MRILAGVLGIALIIVALGDAFETVVLPRRVTRRLRLARLFYRYTWRLWSVLAHSVSSGRRLENYLSIYGPLSLILLLGIWAGILVVGFGILYWVPGNAVKTPEGNVGLLTCVYYSGTSFFTLGLGDVTPTTVIARGLAVVEAGTGFGFLAIVISYLPALNQSFSRREISISLLDARAGSPPTAVETVCRNMWDKGEAFRQLLFEWERWSAEFLESHLSFPVLVYFRSQHDNQSWLGALTAIMDASAVAIVGLEGACQSQARLTFAMARHAIVDMALVLQCPPREPEKDRLPAGLQALQAALEREGPDLHLEGDTGEKLRELRRMYEPYVYALSEYLCLSLPAWVPEANQPDNWQISEWGPRAGFKRIDKPGGSRSTHF
ncbi:MAG TPA: potassium channel family protein [Thermodesulfovibrionales bacterium]|nr:potassium channel family protein [Thermodesulfovibrionales bacterium]